MNGLRMGLALGGFALALLSVTYDERRLAWAAIALLAGSLLVRLWLRRGQDSEGEGDKPL
jgi:hypothetical protein